MNPMSQRIHIPRISRSVVRPGFDPQAQPVISAKPLAGLAAHSMQLDFIRAAFNSPITWNVEPVFAASFQDERSEEHTSELQSLMRISYAVFCLKKKQT